MAAGKATPRRARPRRSRDEIIEAAARIFYAKGYDAASIQDIADELGILKGSIYYHVRSKEDMLFEILERAHDTHYEKVADIPSLPGGPLAQLREFVSRHVLHCAINPIPTGIFFRDFTSLHGERRAIIVAKRDEYEDVLRSILLGGRDAGVVCADLEPGLTAREIVGMLNWTTQWYRPDGPLPPGEIAASMADFVLFGVACDPATHTPGHRRRFAARPAAWDGNGSGTGEPEPRGGSAEDDEALEQSGWLSSVRWPGSRRRTP